MGVKVKFVDNWKKTLWYLLKLIWYKKSEKDFCFYTIENPWTKFEVIPPYQVIPGILQKYVSTNRSLLQYKTLPAHFSNTKLILLRPDKFRQ